MPTNHITRTEINIDARAVPLVARVNRRAKRLILRVDAAAGEIHVTAPSQRAVPEAIAFARERGDWIARQLDEALRAKPFFEGGSAPIRGLAHKIVRDGGARAPVRLMSGPAPTVLVGGAAEHLHRRLTEWLKREARNDLIAAVDRHCEKLGKKRRQIRIRDTRSRWGSCTSDGALSFSWRLIMAPPQILDYVAAHECVHLLHMNHSPAFWRQVRALGVDPRGAEDWFDKHGAQLFAYGARKNGV
ncbi:MAG: SprT family zinc-dependent metalloprotease [Pseudomonadota bacterium]